MNLANKAEIDEFWRQLKGVAIPDILINNAGIFPGRDFLKVNKDFLDNILDINMNSVFWMCQKFIELRGKTGGIIVNTSSIEAILPFKKDMTHYAISKAGVMALTRSLARDYGSIGIRANVVMPGAITTPATMKMAKGAILTMNLGLFKTGYDFMQRIANGKWGEPDDVAKVVIFLASDLASYVQGAILPVDGGFLSS